MKKKSRKNVTLIEIIVVMFFITIITGVIAYNIKGALDEGKAFRSLESMKQLESVLNLEYASGDLDIDNLNNDAWQNAVKNNPLVKSGKSLFRDGWGRPFEVQYDEEKDEIIVTSRKFAEYVSKNPSSKFKKNDEDE